MHFSGVISMGRKIVDYVFRSSDQAGLPSYNTAGPVTFLASDLLQRLILRDCNGAARNDTTPTAQQIIDALTVMGRTPVAGQSFEFIIRNSSAGAFASTLIAGTGVTLSGTPATAQSQSHSWMVVVNNPGATPTVTFYSLGAAAF